MSIIDLPVIDTDTHYTEAPDLWTSRAPARLKGRVLRVERMPEGTDVWKIGDETIGGVGPQVIKPDGTKIRGLSLPNLEAMAPGGTDPAARLRVMDELGISAQIIYPNIVGFGATRFMDITHDDGLRDFHITAYNDAMADLQRAGKGRLFPQAVLPLWDMEFALRELRRCREELSLTGFAMTDNPTHFGQPPLADPVWDRFWATCQELALPVNFHIGSGNSADVAASWWGAPREGGMVAGFDGAKAAFFSVSLFMANFRQISNLILTGILDRYPELKIVSVESGVGWIPFVIDSLEYAFDEIMTLEESRAFALRPSEYFQRNILACYWFEGRDQIDPYLERFGADNLLFETDYPHPQSLYPRVQEKIEETLGHQDPAVQRKVLYENAQRIYGIDLAGL
jgi:predicted TIM-barrel fold metal-dependent hydrolase